LSSKESEILKIKKFSNNIRKNILEMALSAGASSSHFGGALSIVEIISFLFGHHMKFNKEDPLWEDRDRFILSKGHACLAYYSALSEIGFISKEELKTFEKDDSNLLGHPVLNKKLGIEYSNGSLGMGLSIGIGVALSIKRKKKNNNVYVVLGDGECNEGSVWEAAMAAPNYDLDNLYAFIDNNNFQQTGSNEDIMNLGELSQKWSSFGWEVVDLDGHNIEEIFDFFKDIKKSSKPIAIIAKTIKGKGFSFAENNNDWHHAVLTKSIYEKALEELKNN
jgi:transketolase